MRVSPRFWPSPMAPAAATGGDAVVVVSASCSRSTGTLTWRRDSRTSHLPRTIAQSSWPSCDPCRCATPSTRTGRPSCWSAQTASWRATPLNKWMAGWKARGWKKQDGREPMNIDILKSLDRMRSQGRRVLLEHVKAHTGRQDRDSRYNAIADLLATQAAGRTPQQKGS